MGSAYPRSSLVLLIVPLIEQILWLAFALAWGTTHLLYTRTFTRILSTSISMTSVENTWGFGQVFPVVLLAVPMLSIGESYYGKRI